MAQTGINFIPGDQPFVRVWVGDPSGTPTLLGLMPDGDTSEKGILGSLINFTFQHQKGDVGTLELELFDHTNGLIEDKIFASKVLESRDDGGTAKGSAIVGFEFGWSNGAKSLKWVAHVTKFTTNFDIGSGTRISLTAVGGPGIFQSGRDTICWAKGTPIQTIVDYYARKLEYNLPSIITPPAKDLSIDLAQAGQSHLSFLQNVLPKHMIPTTGRGSYVFYNDGGNRHVIFEVDGARVDNVEWQYVFGREPDSLLESFETNLNSNALRAFGGQGLKAHTFDQRNKVAKEHVINDTTTQGRRVIEQKIAKASAYPNILRSGLDNDDVTIAYAEAKFNALNMTNITASAVIMGNPSIQLTDLVTILVVRKKSSEPIDARDLHPVSGKFFIEKISQVISVDGNYKTELSLIKQGARDGRYGGSTQTKGTAVAKAAAEIAAATMSRSQDMARVAKASENIKKRSRIAGLTQSQSEIINAALLARKASR